jgi:hypothetical protein
MSDSLIVKDRWNEKIDNMIQGIKIWNSNKTSEEKQLDQQLRFYERMLEQQAAIARQITQLQQEVERNIGVIGNEAMNVGKGVARDVVIKKIFGEITKDATSFATKPIEEAINTVQKEAKSMEFRGLVKAYNTGMAEELSKAGGDVNKAHDQVIKNLQTNPYQYTDKTLAQFGNILDNKDCDGSNPHCIQRDVFWKAMKKSFNYQHSK